MKLKLIKKTISINYRNLNKVELSISERKTLVIIGLTRAGKSILLGILAIEDP